MMHSLEPPGLESVFWSLAIVVLGFSLFLVTLHEVVDYCLPYSIDFDPREDPCFRYLGFVGPTATTLLVLVVFHSVRCIPMIRAQRYSACLGALASSVFVGLSFCFFMA